MVVYSGEQEGTTLTVMLGSRTRSMTDRRLDRETVRYCLGFLCTRPTADSGRVPEPLMSSSISRTVPDVNPSIQ